MLARGKGFTATPCQGGCQHKGLGGLRQPQSRGRIQDCSQCIFISQAAVKHGGKVKALLLLTAQQLLSSFPTSQCCSDEGHVPKPQGQPHTAGCRSAAPSTHALQWGTHISAPPLARSCTPCRAQRCPAGICLSPPQSQGSCSRHSAAVSSRWPALLCHLL